jgi:thiamine biosynthesis protein ThiI
MPEQVPEIILLRLSGEISVKAKATRGRFEAKLLRNLADALHSEGIAAPISRSRSRIFVASGDPRAPEILARVFGVQSVSLAHVGPADKVEQVVETGRSLFGDAVAGRRFAVRARRVGDRSPGGLSTREIERELGTALLAGAAGVDLDDPEFTARVELHQGQAYYCADTWPGPAGLPLDVEGRALSLLSGGFDSAVASWQLLRRGVRIDYLFCNLGGRTHEQGTLRVAQVLADRWSYGGRPQLHAVDFEAVAAEIRARTQMRFWQILLKRQMLRAADLVGRTLGAGPGPGVDALITGEAVGQVSSQTLPNLATISQATSLPILRPLVGMNKDDIIRAAERIGTAPISAVMDEYCAMVPTRPATTSSVAAVEAEEVHLDPAVLQRAVAERRVFDLRALELDAMSRPELAIDVVPDDATVLDLRSRAAYAAWHWPGALHLHLDHALHALPAFPRDRRYVLVCEFGLKSEHLAERMRRDGLDAWNFRGGLKGLVAHAREQGRPEPELV